MSDARGKCVSHLCHTMRCEIKLDVSDGVHAEYGNPVTTTTTTTTTEATTTTAATTTHCDHPCCDLT